MTNAVMKTEASRAVREKGARVFPISPPLYFGESYLGGRYGSVYADYRPRVRRLP